MNPAHAEHGRGLLVKDWKKVIEKVLSRACETYHNNAHSTPMFAKRMLNKTQHGVGRGEDGDEVVVHT
jgi:hypothetical protein